MSPGVFLFKGSRVSISGITISLTSDPTPPAQLSLGYDVYPQWILAAIEHAEHAEKSAATVDRIWTGKGHKTEVKAFEREMRHSMQAAVASATSFDAFYDTVKQLSEDDKASTTRRKSAPRFARIAERLRRSFKMGPQTSKAVRSKLELLFKFRDEALHPPASIRDTYEHPRLQVGMERRFLMYRAENAIACAQNSLSIISQLVKNPKAKYPKLVGHCAFADVELTVFVRRWEKLWGPLLPRD